MSTPAEHAATVREVLHGRKGGEAEFRDALAALDALQAQAEKWLAALKEIDTESKYLGTNRMDLGKLARAALGRE